MKDEFRTLDRSVLARLQNSLGDENRMIVTTLTDTDIYINTLAQRIQQIRIGTINKEMDMLKRIALKGDSKQIGALQGHLCERFESRCWLGRS